MIQIISASLLDAKTHIIAHQVNCQGVMGSGVAKSIKEKYPEVYSAYHTLCKSAGTQSWLLGECQLVDVGDLIVANLFGQLDYNRNALSFKKQTSESDLETALYRLSVHAKGEHLTVGFPYGMGSVRGGARWSEVDALIRKYFDEDMVTYYKYEVEDSYKIRL